MSRLTNYVKQALKQADYRYDIKNLDSANTFKKFLTSHFLVIPKSVARGSVIGAGLGALVGSFTGDIRESAINGAEWGVLIDNTQYSFRFYNHYFTRNEKGQLKIWELADRLK